MKAQRIARINGFSMKEMGRILNIDASSLARIYKRDLHQFLRLIVEAKKTKTLMGKQHP